MVYLYTRLSFFILFPSILVEVIQVQSFSPQSSILINQRYSTSSSSSSSSSSSHQQRIDHLILKATSNGREKNYLMDEFRTADGQIINPYKTLKVDRRAPHAEIRASYRKLSKKYHPDACRYRKIMPGSCNNFDDVREEWERINLSYEILSDKKMRKKYDRQSALNDPGTALGRAALDTVGWGVSGLAKGVFYIGKQAVDAATKKQDQDGVQGVQQQEDEGENDDGNIVKLDMERVERKKRMVQHINVETSTSTSTSSHVNQESSSNRNNQRLRQRQRLQYAAVASGSGSGGTYPSLAIVGYNVAAKEKNNNNNLLGDILALGAGWASALNFNNNAPLFSSNDFDFDWSHEIPQLFETEMPQWFQEIHQTALLPFQENVVNAVEKCFNHFFE